MDNHLQIWEQNKKKTMIWTFATKLKCPYSVFFKNYVQHITNIHDTFFRSLNIKESKKYIYRAPIPWTTTPK